METAAQRDALRQAKAQERTMARAERGAPAVALCACALPSVCSKLSPKACAGVGCSVDWATVTLFGDDT